MICFDGLKKKRNIQVEIKILPEQPHPKKEEFLSQDPIFKMRMPDQEGHELV
jgi:hypothetical protein